MTESDERREPATDPTGEHESESESETESMTETGQAAETERTDDPTDTTAARVRRGVDYLLLAGLAIFALVAAVGLYTSTQGVIRTWVTPDFRPIANAAFNLVVLLVVGAGLVRQVRRLS